jgi:hypothetical protein
MMVEVELLGKTVSLTFKQVNDMIIALANARLEAILRLIGTGDHGP